MSRSRLCFKVDALCPFHDAAAKYGFTLPKSKADTIGGLVLEILGRMPEPEEQIDLPPMYELFWT